MTTNSTEIHAIEQAKENVDKWGQQPPAELALAMVEELGELVAEIEVDVDPDAGTGDPAFEANYLLERTEANGKAARRWLESEYEDEDGPLPADERPSLPAVLEDTDSARDEMYDLVALCHQLNWAIYQGVGSETDP